MTDKPNGVPEVALPRRRRLSPVWALPIVAALIAGWLGWRWLSERGPEIVITFPTGEGLEAGRTKIKHKNVDLGTIETIRLSDDLSKVVATARMDRAAAGHLRQTTRFWAVRPRLGLSGISGLSTVVSGTYVELEPGGGESRHAFDALDDPPVIQSNEPGRGFTLKAQQLGSLAQGSPVYFRGVQIGEIMGYTLSPSDRAVSVAIFVRAPYDALVRETTRFWHASGLQVTAGTDGFKLQTESLRTLALGGVVLDTPSSVDAGAPAAEGASFKLYDDAATAAADRERLRVRYRLEFPGSVQGLQAGAPVLLRGLPVGQVVGVHLEYDVTRGEIHVPVDIEFESDRVQPVNAPMIGGVADAGDLNEAEARRIIAAMVDKGLRARLASGNLLTGQKLVAFDFEPNAPRPPPGQGPGSSGGSELPTLASSDLEAISRSAGAVMDSVAGLPLAGLVEDLRRTIQSVGGVAGSPDLARSLAGLARALGSADTLLRTTNGQLPALIASLRGVATAAQGTLTAANGVIGGTTAGTADLAGVMKQLNDAARSFRVLADYLERHPEALIRGKTGAAP